MSNETEQNDFRERVRRAAETALKRNGSVGPLELMIYMGFLPAAHFNNWLQGSEHMRTLEESIQVGPEKLRRTLRYFDEWIKERRLRPIEAAYTRRGVEGVVPLRITADGDREREKFFQLRYVPDGLSEKKASRLSAKLNRVQDLVVFEKVGEDGNCAECGTELARGVHFCREGDRPLCLDCADMSHLVFLPSGDTALTRRARKHSTLAAVVVRFNRSRNRYERQGLLVSREALAQAEAECAADAPERAAARARAAAGRDEQDRVFVAALSEAVLNRFPGCPVAEAYSIAEHAGLRGSGRVGRSAAGRELEPEAVDLAVIAHIRHTHTKYDALLMGGTERMEARKLVRAKIDGVLDGWRGRGGCPVA